MKQAQRREQLRQQLQTKAAAIIDDLLTRSETEELTLSEIEAWVGEAKFELTRQLVQSVVELQAEQAAVPGPRCEGCGQEMHYKGPKKRRIITSQGEIEVKRPYYYCAECRQGLFPPGSATEAEPT